MKNWEFDKEAPQNFCLERETIAERQGSSEDQNSGAKPTQSKTNFSFCLSIQKEEEWNNMPLLPTILQDFKQRIPLGNVRNNPFSDPSDPLNEDQVSVIQAIVQVSLLKNPTSDSISLEFRADIIFQTIMGDKFSNDYPISEVLINGEHLKEVNENEGLFQRFVKTSKWNPWILILPTKIATPCRLKIDLSDSEEPLFESSDSDEVFNDLYTL